MVEGHIKLFRKLKKSSFYKDSIYVHVWVHLLLSANWSEKRIKLDGSDQFIDIKPGQFLTSRTKLSAELGINRSKLERILNALKSEQQIEQQTFSKYRVISICNWSEYQQSEQQNEPQMSSKRAASEQQVSTNNNNKNKKNNNLSASDDAAGGNEPDYFLTRRKRKLHGKRLDTFNQFWEAFDFKRGKAEAADAWLDIPALTDKEVAKILLAAKAESIRRPSIMAEGRIPKMAQGWISGRRWEDEAPEPKKEHQPDMMAVSTQDSEAIRRTLEAYNAA